MERVKYLRIDTLKKIRSTNYRNRDKVKTREEKVAIEIDICYLSNLIKQLEAVSTHHYGVYLKNLKKGKR